MKPDRVWAMVIGCVTGNALAMLPVFMLGALIPFFDRALTPRASGIGAAVAFFFLASAVVSIPGGHWVDRHSAQWLLIFAVTVTVTAVSLAATFGSSWLHILMAYAIAGGANGLVQPAANVVLVKSVRTGRRGVTLALKQSAAPLAALIAGALSAPLATAIGWRGVMVLLPAALLPIVWATLARGWTASPSLRDRSDTKSNHADRKLAKSTPSVGFNFVAPAALFGAAAASTLGPFLVPSMVEGGVSATFAGQVLAIGGGAAVAVRIVAGLIADARGISGFPVAAALLALGSVGFLLLGFADSHLVWVAASVLAFGAGWGWPGVYHLGVVAANPSAVGAATGLSQVGIYIGGVGAPFLFGVMAANSNWAGAWAVTAFWAVAGAYFFTKASLAIPGRVMQVEARGGAPRS